MLRTEQVLTQCVVNEGVLLLTEREKTPIKYPKVYANGKDELKPYFTGKKR